MSRLIPFFALLALPAAAENLLLNPGFEDVEGGKPAHWHLFVMPMGAAAPAAGATAVAATAGGPSDAEGRLDSAGAFEGRYSARLHNPKPYGTEPANNWSQNIIAEVVGKELIVTGNIKTEDADEAALWLQCFRKDPWGVILAASTKTETLMRGTHDWTPVRMKVKVPDGTDFLVLRCVLKGTGTAWFDDLSVETPEPNAESESSAKKPAEPVPPERKPTTPRAEAGKLAKPGKWALPKPASTEPPASPPPPAASPPPPAASPPPMTITSPGLESDIAKSLLDATQAMVETNQSLRDLNLVLLDRVMKLEEENDVLRKQAPELGPVGRTPLAPRNFVPPASPVSPNAPQRRVQQAARPKAEDRVPPLVPHGFDMKTLGSETPVRTEIP